MAAVTTPGNPLGPQLTFPTNFEDIYAWSDAPLRYAPSSLRAREMPLVGNDLQAEWHAQKSSDAHRRVMNAVKDTRTATQRFLVSHAGYYEMPKPVLSQRVFANPSLGAQSYYYDRPVFDNLQGGVLRSAKGQAFGKNRLLARIRELDEIDASAMMAEAAAAAELPEAAQPLGISQGLPEQAGTFKMVELLQLVDATLSSAQSPSTLSRISLGDAIKMTLMLFSLAPKMNREELQSLVEAFDESVEVIEQELELAIDEAGAATSEQRIVARAMFSMIKRLRQYLTKMLGGINLAPREREQLSRALVRDLGFSQLNMRGQITQLRREEATQDAAAGLPPPPPGAPRGGPGGYGDDDEDGFDRPARPREDTTNPAANARAVSSFRAAQTVRERFGANSSYGYFGEPAEEAETEAAEDRRNATNPFRQASESADFDVSRMREVPLAESRRAAAPTPSMAEADAALRGFEEARAAVTPRRVRAVLTPEERESLAAPAAAPAAPAAAPATGAYYKLSRKTEIHRGPTHIHNGQLMTGATHRANSVPLFTSLADAQREYADLRQRALSSASVRATIPKSLLSRLGVAASGEATRGRGKSKKWIQEAVKTMKKGAFTKQAAREGETPKEYMKEVLANPKAHTETTRKRAQFLKNILK